LSGPDKTNFEITTEKSAEQLSKEFQTTARTIADLQSDPRVRLRIGRIINGFLERRKKEKS
jgi:hypothetical protein